MPFAPGDEAVVISLNRRGRILDAQGERYRVALGTLTVLVPASDLRPPEVGKKRKKGQGRQEGAGGRHDQGVEPGGAVIRRIDLHGMTVEAAREAVLAAVNEAVLAGASTLEIVHGIGTGRVRDAAWRELKRLAVVRHVRPHPTNHGITIAHL